MKDIEELEKGLYFVYCLSHNGNIFYVGMTKNVLSRYKTHLSNTRPSPLRDYIKSILEAGELPTLTVVTYQRYIEAESIEATLIKCMSIGGQRLFNCQHFRGEKINTYTNRKDKYKAIEAIQNEYKLKVERYGAYYCPSIRQTNKRPWQK